MKTWVAATLLLLLGTPLELMAASTTLNYQGRVIANGVAFQGTGQFKFALISPDGNTYYWKNDATTGLTDPASAVSLAVNRGLFSVRLGDTAIPNMTGLDSTVLANAGLKLRVWFNDGVKGFQRMIPDQTLNSDKNTSVQTSSLYLANAIIDSNGTLAKINPGVWEFFQVPIISTGTMWIKGSDVYSKGPSSTTKFATNTKTSSTVTGGDASPSSSDSLLVNSCTYGGQAFLCVGELDSTYSFNNKIVIYETDSTPPIQALKLLNGQIKNIFPSTSKLFINSTTSGFWNLESVSGYYLCRMAVVGEDVWVFTKGCAARASVKSLQNLFIRN
jgi:hypothetical protein